MKFLVLFVMLFWFSTAQYGSDEHFTASADTLTREFISTFLEAVRSSDRQKLMDLIDKSLVFHGCDDGYNRSKLVEMLIALPDERKENVKVEVKSVEFYTDWDIVWMATIDEVECAFFLHGGRQRLMKGSVTKCPGSE